MSRFNPYNDNGGTAVALCGKGYCLVGADTRMSSGYSILHRNTTKCFQPTVDTVVASAGMQSDRIMLHKQLAANLEWYSFSNQGRIPDVASLQQLMSNMLYGRRFAPWLTYNILAGLDKEGNGVAYSFDIFGSTEPIAATAAGTSAALVEPFLDSLTKQRHLSVKFPDFSLEDAKKLMLTVFSAATEREITTGCV